MTAIEVVYAKYVHLDYLFVQQDWLPDDALGRALYDLWQAVKQEATRATPPRTDDVLHRLAQLQEWAHQES